MFIFGQVGSAHRNLPRNQNWSPEVNGLHRFTQWAIKTPWKWIGTANSSPFVQLISGPTPGHMQRRQFQPSSNRTTRRFTTSRKHANITSVIPTIIIPNTPPPSKYKQKTFYPNAAEWTIAQELEPDHLHDTGTTGCLYPTVRPTSRPLPIAEGYRYNWATGGQLLTIKARGALRGDLKLPFTHFNREHLDASMDTKSTIRLLFELQAKSGFII